VGGQRVPNNGKCCNEMSSEKSWSHSRRHALTGGVKAQELGTSSKSERVAEGLATHLGCAETKRKYKGGGLTHGKVRKRENMELICEQLTKGGGNITMDARLT